MIPEVRLREWSTLDPVSTPALRRLALSPEDRELLAGLPGGSLRVHELLQGLRLEAGPYGGTLQLSRLRVHLVPKIGFRGLLRLAASTYGLSDLVVLSSLAGTHLDSAGLVDLLALAYLRAVESVARGGLMPRYVPRVEVLSSPKGKLDLRHAATRPPAPELQCRFSHLTVDHRLNRVLAAGLRFTARLTLDRAFRLHLSRSAARLFPDVERAALSETDPAELLSGLDRRTTHYREPLALLDLLVKGSLQEDPHRIGEQLLPSFLLNLDLLFERFLDRHLARSAPPRWTVLRQNSRCDSYRWRVNPLRWSAPTLRPDLEFRRGGVPVALGDAKYRNRMESPPGPGELYQLTTYGLAAPLPEPRRVVLFHPLSWGVEDKPAEVIFRPVGLAHEVRIRICGVPVDRILEGEAWWPAEALA